MLVNGSHRCQGTCDTLEWDSAFFARRIARFRLQRCTPADFDPALKECADVGIECLYILVDASDTESIVTLQEKRVFLADIRVTFGTEISVSRSWLQRLGSQFPVPGSDDAIRTRLAIDSDIPALGRIASVSHRDTRFYADGHFATEQCNRLYELWIEKSCRGYADAVLVVEDDAGQLAGYVTCHRDRDAAGHIGLFAVREDARGRGIARELLKAALGWFSTNNIAAMTVATQLRNVRALRFYSRAHLFISAVEYWFHLWPGDASV